MCAAQSAAASANTDTDAVTADTSGVGSSIGSSGSDQAPSTTRSSSKTPAGPVRHQWCARSASTQGSGASLGPYCCTRRLGVYSTCGACDGCYRVLRPCIAGLSDAASD